MGNIELVNRLVQDTILKKASVKKMDMRNSTMAVCGISTASIKKITVHTSLFKGCFLAPFFSDNNIRVKQSYLHSCVVDDCSIDSAIFNGVIFKNVAFHNVYFYFCDFSKAVFRDCTFSGCIFDSCAFSKGSIENCSFKPRHPYGAHARWFSDSANLKTEVNRITLNSTAFPFETVSGSMGLSYVSVAFILNTRKKVIGNKTGVSSTSSTSSTTSTKISKTVQKKTKYASRYVSVGV